MRKKDFFEQDKRFFVQDLKKLKERVLQTCSQEEIAGIIERADDACRQSFRFDLRWDMEYTEEAVSFPDQIQWLYQPADDPEWVYALNRHHYWITLGQAYVMTGDEKYAEAFVRQCKSWICQISLTDPDCALACRTLETGIRLNFWIKAFCLFADSPALTDSFCSLFEDSVIEQQKVIFNTWDTTKIISNWGVLENHGLFTSALLMPPHAQSEAMLQEALRRLDLQLQHQVYPDGAHWEQSMMYHNEVAQAFLEVKILAQRNGIALPEGFADKIHRMIEFSIQTCKPDGIEVAMGDSDDIDVRDLISKAAWSFQDPAFKAAGYPQWDWDCLFDLGAEAAEEYDQLDTLAMPSVSRWFSDSGHIVMRTAGSDGVYLHFFNGIHGGGHAHEDKLHLDVFAYGEDIIRDSGRLTYVDKPERFEFKGPQAHNVIELDDQPSILCKRSWGYRKRSWSINTQWRQAGSVQLAQGTTLGYMELKQGSAVVSRKVLWLREDLILVHDEIAANPQDQHKIVQRWHFAPQAQAALRGNTLQLELEYSQNELLILTEGAHSEVAPTRLSLHYNTTTPSSMLVTELNQKGFASMPTIFSLNRRGQKQPCFAVSVPVSLVSRQDRPFEKKQAEAWILQKGRDQFTVMIAHEDLLGPSDAILVDGKLGMGQILVWEGQEKGQWATVLQ